MSIYGKIVVAVIGACLGLTGCGSVNSQPDGGATSAVAPAHATAKPDPRREWVEVSRITDASGTVTVIKKKCDGSFMIYATLKAIGREETNIAVVLDMLQCN